VSARRVTVGARPLTLEDLAALAAGGKAALATEARARMEPSRNLVVRALNGTDPVYGVNTGFGALKSVRVSPADVERLQLNLIRSHAAGAGPELEPAAVRLMLALRAQSLAQGMSGVRVELVEHLLAMLERGLLPVVP